MITPSKLKKGDTIGLCSPSGTIAHKEELFNRAVANFEKATGLKVMVAPNALNCHCYSAGTPQERLADFHSLIADKNIKAIIFSAGGDTAIDLVEHIDYNLIKNNPKIISGISDATTLLSAITAKTDLVTFLGLEFLDFADNKMPYALESIKKSWFDGKVGRVEPNKNWRELKKNYTKYHTWQTIRPGKAEGTLLGGNSESFIQLLDTDYGLSFEKSILFLETYKLPKKQIHKMLMQLKLRGVLDQIKGLIFGYCLECDNPQVVGNEQPLSETILEVTQEYSFPIMQIGEIGHCVENALQPLGVRASMDATNLTFEILEDVTR